MPHTSESRRTTFRRIARRRYGEWPAYDSTPLYDRTSLAGLESGIRTVSETWFDYESHDSVDTGGQKNINTTQERSAVHSVDRRDPRASVSFDFVHQYEECACVLPLAYFRFGSHDRYEGSTRYRMDAPFRVFVLKELYGWEHETALVDHLENHPELCEQLGFETILEQSTLWRS